MGWRPKRGKKGDICQRDRKKRRAFAKEDERKGRNDPFDYAKSKVTPRSLVPVWSR